jgi:LAO/AO transport system kinase
MSARTELAAQLASPAGLGRLLTLIENDAAERARILAELPEVATPAHRIGVTGSPGVGKSTLLARLVPLLGRAAILAIDPTSEQTGGAVLADRFRWNELPPGVFVRSLASRGSLAGVSAGTDASARVLEAAGYNPVVIETVGVGQTGFEVRGLADTVVVLLSPESGDALQLLKAGLIETGDIFVVNKADRPGADALLTDLRSALEPAVHERSAEVWQPRVLAVSALEGEGIAELAQTIAEHRHWLADHPREESERGRKSALLAAARAHLDRQLAASLLDSTDLLARLNAGEIDLDAAALALLERMPR